MNNNLKIFIIALAAIGVFCAIFFSIRPRTSVKQSDQSILTDKVAEQTTQSRTEEPHPMEIEYLRQRDFPGEDFTIEENLPNGTNYRQYVASYRSEGFKIYGLLTVPLAQKPEKGFPAIVFVHGHIPPKQYSTTGSYPSYQATLARAGFVTFKPDLRGHGRSEGEAVGAASEKYLVDTLFALAHLKEYESVDPTRIGYWGHSNGSELGLRAAVVSKEIKAYALWSGVVGSFEDELETYNDKIPFLRNANESPIVQENKLPSRNPDFWKKMDPYSYLTDISAPIELHHGTADPTVPIELSRHLDAKLKEAGKNVQLFEYAGDDHNIGQNSGLAWQRTIEFCRKNL